MNQCVICQKRFTPPIWRPKALTCSQKCNGRRQDARRKPLRRLKFRPRPCRRCAQLFIPKFRVGRRQRYCSRKCQIKTNYALYMKRHSPAERLVAAHKKKWGGLWLAAIQRDGWKCVRCGAIRNLLVHHLDGSGESVTTAPNHDIGNLQTLCWRCHKKAHSLLYRVIGGKVYIGGLALQWLKVGKTLKILKE